MAYGTVVIAHVKAHTSDAPDQNIITLYIIQSQDTHKVINGLTQSSVV